MTITFTDREMTDVEFKREQAAFDEHGQDFGNPPETAERFGFVTTDNEAPGFYAKQGYTVFATQENWYPSGHARVGFIKELL